MRYVAAYLLAALGGNNSPSAADLKKILASVGIEAESDKIDKIIGELKGKNLETLMAEGNHIWFLNILNFSLKGEDFVLHALLILLHVFAWT